MLDAVVVSDALAPLCGGGLRAAAILTTPTAVPALLFRNGASLRCVGHHLSAVATDPGAASPTGV